MYFYNEFPFLYCISCLFVWVLKLYYCRNLLCIFFSFRGKQEIKLLLVVLYPKSLVVFAALKLQWNSTRLSYLPGLQLYSFFYTCVNDWSFSTLRDRLVLFPLRKRLPWVSYPVRNYTVCVSTAFLPCVNIPSSGDFSSYQDRQCHINKNIPLDWWETLNDYFMYLCMNVCLYTTSI